MLTVIGIGFAVWGTTLGLMGVAVLMTPDLPSKPDQIRVGLLLGIGGAALIHVAGAIGSF